MAWWGGMSLGENMMLFPAPDDDVAVVTLANATREGRAALVQLLRRLLDPPVVAGGADRRHLTAGERIGRMRLKTALEVIHKEHIMPNSVYKIVELVGTSPESWEMAAANAVRTAAQSLQDLRIAEVVEQDLHIEDDASITYRVRLKLSFKYHAEA